MPLMFMSVLNPDPLSSVNPLISQLSMVSWGGPTRDDRLFLFCLDPAGVLQYWECNADLEWSGPHSVGGQPFLGPPAIGSWGPGELDVFGIVTTEFGPCLAHRSFSRPTGWSSQLPYWFGELGGSLTDPLVAPAVLAGAPAGRFNVPDITVFWGGSNAYLYSLRLRGSRGLRGRSRALAPRPHRVARAGNER